MAVCGGGSAMIQEELSVRCMIRTLGSLIIVYTLAVGYCGSAS